MIKSDTSGNERVNECGYEKNPSSLLGVTAIARWLEVSSGTIYYWVSRREIPYIKVGRHLRFDKAEVVAFFRSKTSSYGAPCAARPREIFNGSRSLKTRDTSQDGFPGKETDHGYM